MFVRGYLGSVLDGSAAPVGTCFQVSAGVLVTAAHVLEQAGADTEVRVRALYPAGPVMAATVRRVDGVHDLAVLACSGSLPESVSALVASDDLRLNQLVHLTGVADVPYSEHRHEYLDAFGSWAGGTVRQGDGARLGRMRCQDVMLGMSGSPVRRAGDDAVVGVVSGRYNSGDGWLRDSVWVARTEDLASLLDGLTTVTCARPSLEPGGAELARWTVDLLSAIDAALTGRSAGEGLSRTVHELVAEVVDESQVDGVAFRGRLRAHGLEPAVLLTWLPQHARAIARWSSNDDGECAALLARLRVRLAAAVEDGRLPATSATAPHIASALRGTPSRPDFADRLADLVPVARSTSREAVIVREQDAGEQQGSVVPVPGTGERAPAALDVRGQRLSHVARHMCELRRADGYLTGRDEVVAKLCAATTDGPGHSVLWLSGRPGVGASEVALHVAHRTASHYDTVLYVDLYGRQAGSRRSVRTVARMLLEALGEPITSRLGEDEALFDTLRRVLGSTRSLLVLDNVRDAGEVAPVVRDSGAATVIVTSHQRRQSLADPALAVHLPVLDPSDSVGLLRRFAADVRPRDHRHLEHIAGLCDNLPLALRLVGARLTARPEVAVSEWARLLTHEHSRLNFLSDDERAVRSAIMLGYVDMDPPERHTTRYLSAVPGAVATEAELTHALDADEAVTALSLHRVVDASMADCEGAGGSIRSPLLAFRLPELVRLVAAERLTAEESPQDIRAFRRRSTQYLADRMSEIVHAAEIANLELEMDPTRAHTALDIAVSHSWWDIAEDLGRDLRVIYNATWDLPALTRTVEALVTVHLATTSPGRAVRSIRDLVEVLASADSCRGDALSWAQRGERIAAEHGLREEHVDACLLVGDVAARLKEYRVAYNAMIRTYELLEAHGRADESGTVLVNLAKLAQHAPEVVDGPRNASWWADRAIALADRVGDADTRAQAHFERARIGSDTGERVLALRHYKIAAMCWVSCGVNNNAAVVAQNTADLHGDDPHGAHAAWAEAVRLWRLCPDEKARLAHALVMLSSLQRQLGMNEDLAQSLAEAHETCPTDHTLLHHEIAVRLAASRCLSGAEHSLPAETVPPPDGLVSEAAQSLASPTRDKKDDGLLDQLLRASTINGVENYPFWVFDELKEPAGPRPTIGPSQP